MSKVYENMKARRSIRAFTDQEISKEDLMQIADAARWAPSGMNKQTYRFTVLQNPILIKTLARVVAEASGADPETYNFYNPNAMILVSEDRENMNGLANCACALENIFLMAADLGIGSVWINQLKNNCDIPAVREVLNDLNIPSDYVVWGMASLGYAAGTAEAPDRLGVVDYIG